MVVFDTVGRALPARAVCAASVSAGYGCAVPPVANLIARAAVRSLGLGGRAILLGLSRETQRQWRSRSREALDPAPAPLIPGGALVRAVYVAWFCGLAVFALVVLNVDLFLPPGRAVAVFRLAVGAILLVEGLGLAVERFPFRRLLVARLAARPQRGGGRTRRARWPRLVGAALTVLGIVWAGAGVLDVLRGALALL
jgi:hypothetical protein